MAKQEMKYEEAVAQLEAIVRRNGKQANSTSTRLPMN